MKNIPIPNKQSYTKSMIGKLHDFIKRIRWKAFFSMNPQAASQSHRETYGFNSEKTPPQIQELVPFENDLYHLIKNIEYTDQPRNHFQKKLQKDAKEVRSSQAMYIPADKTTNIYKLPKSTYEKLLKDNISAKYKKTNPETISHIDHEAKKIATNLDIADRVEKLARRDAFITLKDHKDNFPNNIKCRLINPAKSEIGRISKKLLEGINDSVRTTLDVCQWRNTNAVIEWFKLND